MALTNEQRKELWTQFMSESSSRHDAISVNKNELGDAVDAVDTWIDDNMASYNSTLPQAVQDTFTAKQKVTLLMIVIKKRWEVS